MVSEIPKTRDGVALCAGSLPALERSVSALRAIYGLMNLEMPHFKALKTILDRQQFNTCQKNLIRSQLSPSLQNALRVQSLAEILRHSFSDVIKKAYTVLSAVCQSAEMDHDFFTDGPGARIVKSKLLDVLTVMRLNDHNLRLVLNLQNVHPLESEAGMRAAFQRQSNDNSMAAHLIDIVCLDAYHSFCNDFIEIFGMDGRALEQELDALIKKWEQDAQTVAGNGLDYILRIDTALWAMASRDIDAIPSGPGPGPDTTGPVLQSAA